MPALKEQKTEAETEGKQKESEYTHYLTLGNVVPLPRGELVGEVKEVVEEIKKWKQTFDNSIRFRWSHKMGKPCQLSDQALGNDLLPFISDEVSLKHIKTLNSDPTIYASRLALVESILEKNENLGSKTLRKLLLHTTIGNYNQKIKVGMGTTKEMISNRNLSLSIEAQNRYLQMCISEATEELRNYQRKIYANKNNDVYYQQTEMILEQITLLESNIGNMKYLKSMSQRLALEQGNLLKTEILLNLSAFDSLEHQTKKLDEQEIHRIQQSTYSLIQVLRHLPLLYPLAYNILERMQNWEVVYHIQVPMSTFARSQLLGGEYLMLLEEFKNAPNRLKEECLKTIFSIFGEWLSFSSACMSKLSVPNSNTKIRNAMTIDYCNYILRHFYSFEIFQPYLPTGYHRSRMSPLFNKGLRYLRYTESSQHTQKLEQALGEALSQMSTD